VANSRTTSDRVRRYFGRESTILHPLVELDRFSRASVGAHYVVLAELMAHERIDIAVDAFTRFGLPLVVVGDDPEGRRLRRIAGPTVTFTGRIPDEQVAEVLAGARALVVTAVEEFGIAAVEALAAGRPGERPVLAAGLLNGGRRSSRRSEPARPAGR
jgi:glycosyltransferase involved in cell wall biosynthesis